MFKWLWNWLGMDTTDIATCKHEFFIEWQDKETGVIKLTCWDCKYEKYLHSEDVRFCEVCSAIIGYQPCDAGLHS